MQSVHQTFLCLSLGAAIILGVAESSSAQIRRSSPFDSVANPSPDPALPDLASEAIAVMPMVASPTVTLDLAPFDHYLVQWSAFPNRDPESPLPTHAPAQSISSVQTRDQSVAQVPESAIGDEAGEPAPTTDPMAEPEATDLVSPSPDDAAPLEPSAESSSSGVDDSTPDDSTPDGNSSDEGTVEVELELAPEAIDPSVQVEMQIPSLESEIEPDPESDEVSEEDASEEDTSEEDTSEEDTSEDSDEVDVDVELNSALIDLPDYLLSPPNPLFVPINPETVERVGTQPISLEQALEMARRNSRELQAAIQTLEQSQQALREARAAYFPTVTATSQLVHRDRDISAESGLSSLAGQPTVDTTLNLDLTVNYDIFTSGLRSATLRAAENNVRLQELQVEVVQEDLRLNITNAYYNLQETDERVRIAQETLAQSTRSLRDAAAREEAGVGTRFDRLQAEVQLAEDEQELVNSIRDQNVARRVLVDALSLPPGIDLSASDPVEVAGSWALPLETTLLLAYRNRAELEQQLVQRDLNQEQARANLANRWPQLSAFASYNMNDLLDVTRSTSDFEDLSVGLQMSWTIYNGGATRAAVRQEAIAAEIDATTFADTREQIRLEVEQEYLNLGAEFKNIQTTESAVGLAKEALRLARLRFSAGVGIQSDVLEAQIQLSEAEGRRVTAILDYNRALIAIQRAVSNWPDHNLSADPIREFLTLPNE
ncbi:MAG: TolC family protein [Leptolyngbyaceae bacterium]|nr:TolC family protein [Leptolyngbyaceae bacterium]